MNILRPRPETEATRGKDELLELFLWSADTEATARGYWDLVGGEVPKKSTWMLLPTGFFLSSTGTTPYKIKLTIYHRQQVFSSFKFVRG